MNNHIPTVPKRICHTSESFVLNNLNLLKIGFRHRAPDLRTKELLNEASSYTTVFYFPYPSHCYTEDEQGFSFIKFLGAVFNLLAPNESIVQEKTQIFNFPSKINKSVIDI